MSIQPFSTLLYARLGNGVETVQLCKMIAGALDPGRPVANLYVSFSCLPLRVSIVETHIVFPF